MGNDRTAERFFCPYDIEGYYVHPLVFSCQEQTDLKYSTDNCQAIVGSSYPRILVQMKYVHQKLQVGTNFVPARVTCNVLRVDGLEAIRFVSSVSVRLK